MNKVNKQGASQPSFERAAKEAGEGKPLDDVLRHLIKPQPKEKGGARKERRPGTRTSD